MNFMHLPRLSGFLSQMQERTDLRRAFSPECRGREGSAPAFGTRRIVQDTPGGYYGGMIADLKKRALHRSRILEGQMRGLQKMIDNEDYCMDIITQSLAIQKSLGSLNKLIVENHLRTHVSDMFEAGGEQQDVAIAELLKVFELNNNRGTDS